MDQTYIPKGDENMGTTYAPQIDAIGGDGFGGFGGFGSNPLLWLITLGFLKGDGGLFGNGGNGEGAAGVLAGQTQSKLDCLAAGQDVLRQQAADNNISAQFTALGNGIAELGSVSRDQSDRLAAIQRADTAAITGQINDLRAQQAECCCETKLGIAGIDTSIQNQTATLLASGLSNTQKILDKINDNALAACQTENANLRQQLTTAEIIASVRNNCGGNGGGTNVVDYNFNRNMATAVSAPTS